MLSVNRLDIRFGDKHLFKDISVRIHEGNRIGLVGVNGAGKSTLLRIMAGVAASDDGVVSRAKNFTVAYLPQESSALVSDNTLYEEAETAFAGLLALQAEAERIHDTLEGIDPDSDDFAALLKRQGEIQHELDGSEIYSIRARIEKVLQGLGFKQDDLNAPVTTFSGGWAMRLMLAKMLLAAPSLLLLDEPTNHLDLESLTWVEEFLRSYKGAMVIISHDRTFLDRTTKLTWEISMGRLTVYKGNYTYYVKEKEERREIERAAFDNQQQKIRQTMRFVERFRAKSTKAKQVQSRVRQLEKMDILEMEEDERQIRFTFPPAPPSGRDVLQIEGLAKGYQQKRVLRNVELVLQRGDKVAVVGVNGAGKTTLVKIIAGLIESDDGQIRFGANVKLSYFGQHQAQELSPQLTALDTMATTGVEMTVTRTRSLLGAFLFRGEEVEKKVAVLSGGEKSRLALAKMIATPANLMVLDEPTNHLDMSSQEVLQEAMAQYDGTIIVVSHNRYFLDSFVNKVLEVKNGLVSLYEGNISEYLRKMQMLADEQGGKGAGDREDFVETAERTLDDVPKEKRKDRRKQEAEKRQERSRLVGPWSKKLTEAENEIEKLEREKELLEKQLAEPDLYKDEHAWSRTSREYDDCKRHLERWYARWETAQEKIDEVDAQLGRED